MIPIVGASMPEDPANRPALQQRFMISTKSTEKATANGHTDANGSANGTAGDTAKDTVAVVTAPKFMADAVHYFLHSQAEQHKDQGERYENKREVQKLMKELLKHLGSDRAKFNATASEMLNHVRARSTLVSEFRQLLQSYQTSWDRVEAQKKKDKPSGPESDDDYDIIGSDSDYEII